MSNHTISIETIVRLFPHPNIPAIIGMPTYASIKATQVLLSANAATIQSPLGDGKLGLIGLVISPTAFATLSSTNTPFAIPKPPPDIPNVTDNATQFQIAQANLEHKTQQKTWHECIITDAAIKQQLIGAIEETYLRPLRDSTTGFATITSWDIIHHLFTFFGKITPQALADNDITIRTPIDLTQPISTYFSTMEDARDFAEAGKVPYTEEQLVMFATTAFYHLHQYHDANREWKHLALVSSSWKQLKSHYMQAYLDLLTQPSALISEGAGYSSANAATIQDLATNTDTALANLASAHTSDRETITQLQAAVNAITTKLARMTSSSDATSTPTVSRTRPPRTNNQNRTPHPTNYCWTHGFFVRDSHTSSTCRFPAAGHVTEATRDTRHNGSEVGIPDSLRNT